MLRSFSFFACLIGVCALGAGCHQPETWSYTGPRVYLIKGSKHECSDGLYRIQHRLQEQEINAKVYSPDDWLRIVADIDDDPDEEAILVGHGHGGFLATQVVRHYAQEHKMKHIDAVFTLDPHNKDWPHGRKNAGIPVGHNAIKVRNYVQSNCCSKRKGRDLITTRASDMAEQHPYYWYDNYWTGKEVNGQRLAQDVTHDDVTHETIDNCDAMVDHLVRLSRKAALSPYHYTPPEHHVDVAQKPEDRRPCMSR